jgi:N-acetylmuramoyl-L-alanine amidase
MSKKTVGVFIGHGNSTDGSWDCGCTYRGYTEAELMKPITGACVAYLKGSGVKVVTDYPANAINMVKQVQKSNDKDLKCHVAFHCDWSKAPSGTLPLYTSKKGRELAVLMNKYVMKYVGIKTLGVKKRTDLYELNTTDAPAVIFECGSIKKDLKTMRKKADAYGKGAARGICEYLGVKFTGKKG